MILAFRGTPMGRSSEKAAGTENGTVIPPGFRSEYFFNANSWIPPRFMGW
jgi:hypothetical protein